MPEAKTETAKKPAEKNDPNKNIILGVIIGFFLLLIIGSGLMVMGMAARSRFLFTRNIGQNQEINDGGYGYMMGRGGSFGRMSGNYTNRISGKVTAANDKKFTIDYNGTSKDVQITDSTRFPISSATTVKVGDTVIVMGQQDSGGVIQAIQVIVNPVE